MSSRSSHEGVGALKVGNPMDRGNQSGRSPRGPARRPGASGSAVRAARRRTAVWQSMSNGGGYYFQPTVLTHVRPVCRPTRGDIRPAAAVIRVKDAEDAVRVANDTDFGLGPISGPKASAGPRSWPSESGGPGLRQRNGRLRAAYPSAV